MRCAFLSNEEVLLLSTVIDRVKSSLRIINSKQDHHLHLLILRELFQRFSKHFPKGSVTLRHLLHNSPYQPHLYALQCALKYPF